MVLKKPVIRTGMSNTKNSCQKSKLLDKPHSVSIFHDTLCLQFPWGHCCIRRITMDLWELTYGCLEMEKALLKISDSFSVKLDFTASGKEVPASCSVSGVGDINLWYFVFSSGMSYKSIAVPCCSFSQSFLPLFVVAQLCVFFLILVEGTGLGNKSS